VAAFAGYAGARVLITGGLGMIGSNLAHALVAAGARVTILDALLPLYGGNRFNLAGIEDRVAVEIGDLRDGPLVERLVQGHDVIFNLAAQVSYLDSMEDPYHLLYHRQYGVRTTGLRLTNPYGVRQQMKHARYGLVNWFVRQAMEGRTITIFGDGLQRRDYVYVADIVDALLLTGLAKATVGGVYNVGAGTATTFREMVDVVLGVVGRGSLAHVPWPPDYPHVDTVDFIADVSALKAATGWQPRVSLRDGVTATARYYEAHRRWYWE
jgi:nucleoside-diphosphate-sugar epimerase